jgi:hypothetical protein
LNAIAGQRTIQVGLTEEAVEKYVNEWITSITDVTNVARQLAKTIAQGVNTYELPAVHEESYPVSNRVKRRLGMD